MNHDIAFQRLPDLLDDRDDPELLAHVRDCATCQRQLFLLGRVDRMLRDRSPVRRRSRTRLLAASAVAAAAAAAAALALVLPGSARGHAFMLRTAAGLAVGHAVMSTSDSRNESLTLNARGMPVARGHMFVLFAGDGAASMEVGHFMVDATGRCHARFNLPATHSWSRFWVMRPGDVSVVAST